MTHVRFSRNLLVGLAICFHLGMNSKARAAIVEGAAASVESSA